ncbi:MAG: restriction endonuclease subunit S, partial [Oscillospiraceae bacterium]
KRDKKESVIFKGDDNSYYLNKYGQCVDIGDYIPFDIPNSWEWTLLGNIIQLNPRNKISDDMEVSFVPMPLIDDGFSGNHVSEIRKWNDVKTGFTHFAEGDIGVAKITPCFENRKSTVFNNLCNGYGAGTTELHILRTYADTISHKFLLFFVKTDYFIQAGKQTFSGAVGQQRIGKEYISNSLFPLPPLAEQERIVNAVETLFAQIDKISEQIL